MSVNRQILLSLAVLLGLFALFELTELDVAVQDGFFRRDGGGWVVSREEPIGRAIFYTGAKVAIIVFGCVCAGIWAASYRRPALAEHRLFCMRMVVAIAAVSLAVAALKKATNVYTPAQAQRYGGKKPIVKVLTRNPPGFETRPGEGWPAGHAAPGFALMMLYHALRRPRWRWAGLAMGLGAGWAMGMYQVLKGAHYISHVLISMTLAWVLILLIARFGFVGGGPGGYHGGRRPPAAGDGRGVRRCGC
jgi:membrane-associated PAP2 superfamily phosphatase